MDSLIEGADALAAGAPGAGSAAAAARLSGDPVGAPELLVGRARTVGRARVQRVLPQRARRMVGVWCFVDLLGPLATGPEAGLDIAPHPHTGLQTLTWLVAGEALHRDSLESEQLLRPGEVNLMTAGRGVAHSEESPSHWRGTLSGAQLWIAQPEETRDGPASFVHLAAPPVWERAGARATVLIGAFGEHVSPLPCATPIVGVELVLGRGASSWPLAARHEHALVVLDGVVHLGGRSVATGAAALLAPGRTELVLENAAPARALLLGGEPFPTPVLMWWNFVARTPAEIVAAHQSWARDDGRFGRVSSPLARLVGPPPPWG